ncbi:hypothetical protein KC345_g10913, partial [Hortaea werneckii]
GAPGVETLLPNLYSAGVAEGKLTIHDLVRLLCENPARVYGLSDRKGSLKTGADADLVILDPAAEWVLDEAGQHSFAGWSLYHGRAMKGKIDSVLVRGQEVYDGERITGRLEGQFVRPAHKAYIPVRPGREWLRQEMDALNLETYLDAASNLIGRLPGTQPELPPILVGSHTDTVTGGGRFDGIAGVAAGLEIVRILRDSGLRLRRTLEIVDFTAEEPTDFGVSTVGSRGMVGTLTETMLGSRDQEGRSLQNCIAAAGGEPALLAEPLRMPGSVAAYLELHIEQGPVLIESGQPLAVVTGIVGIGRYELRVAGQPDHAGTTPMTMRRDALTAAGELFVELERICREPYEAPVVGTVGVVHVSPNAANVVPGEVTFKFEVRSVDPALIDVVCSRYLESARQLVEVRGLELHVTPLTRSEPVAVSDIVQEALTAACGEVLLESGGQGAETVPQIPSGAGHDGNQLSRIAPIGMLFVPSLGGRSHCPEEWTDIQPIAQGTSALARAVLRLDREL